MKISEDTVYWDPCDGVCEAVCIQDNTSGGEFKIEITRYNPDGGDRRAYENPPTTWGVSVYDDRFGEEYEGYFSGITREDLEKFHAMLGDLLAYPEWTHGLYGRPGMKEFIEGHKND